MNVRNLTIIILLFSCSVEAQLVEQLHTLERSLNTLACNLSPKKYASINQQIRKELLKKIKIFLILIGQDIL